MRAPTGLQASGKRLWKSITSEFDLSADPDKAELLFQACRTADQIAELDEAAAEAPLTVKGSMGQPVISPFIAEARVQRGLLAQLLSRMNFEDAIDE
uniref:Terminase n=3 Tax=unclassified Caudoviricetes TaxID=2788787 RepID=A0AB39U259_9CAUD